MIETGLKKAAAVSFAVHIAFAIILLILARTPSFQMPSPYTVRLVSPNESSMKASRVPPAKNEIPETPEKTVEKPSAKAVEKAPPILECVDKNKDGRNDKTGKPCPQNLEDLTKYTSDRIAALKEKKEHEREKEEKESAIARMRKQAKVRELGAQKASVEVKAKAASKAGSPGEAPPLGEVGDKIIADYGGTASSLIHQEWVLAGTGREGLSAIITVMVFKNGTLKITGIERSSGDAVFDRSALRAIEKASPLPPPPFEMELGVTFTPRTE